ncbi:MAG TPA: SBBP repeat-containing protein [Myxococcaceae bacterium]|nr:SBBP repeat-containing protein [Myxococcaceae bacterium]
MQLRSSLWIRSILVFAAPIALLIAIFSTRGAGSTSRAQSSTPSKTERQVQSTGFGMLPLAFEANRGQAPEEVSFVARTQGGSVSLTRAGAVFALRRGDRGSRSAAFQMKLRDASRITAIGVDELSGKANYFIGNEPSRWQTGISMYRKVKCSDVLPGIDLIYYGNQRQLEYDFIIRPGANPDAIRWSFEGTEALELSSQGDLIVRFAGNELRQQRPRVYQQIGNETRELHGTYVLASRKEVGFRLGEYDRTQPVVIDPVLLFSTFNGGSAQDYADGVAVDASGVYVVGSTISSNFPLAAPRQSSPGGGFDAFVLKLNPTGSALIYATYLGGSGGDYGTAIAVDGSGNAYVTGNTLSGNFPTANARQTALASSQDAFVTKLSPTGSTLVYSTYLGGNDNDFGNGIAVDGSGNAIIVGSTASTNFPIANAYQSSRSGSYPNAFVTKMTADGSGFVYSTYLGGTLVNEAFGVAVDASGAAYVVGSTTSTNFPTLNAYQSTNRGSRDAFVSKFSSTGSLVYSTYLGGNGQDFGSGIAVDSSGSAIAVGDTSSSNFPVFPQPPAVNPAFQQGLNGSSDGFVTKLSATGNALVYSTFLGGSSSDRALAVAVDGAGNAYVTGETLSTNFPGVGSLQAAGGDLDVFVTQLNALGSALTYSTYLGGAAADSASGIALDSAGNAYVAGQTQSSNFPTASAVQGTYGGGMDAFVAKVGGSTAVLLSSLNPNTGPTAGGTTVALRGANFAPGATVGVGGAAATNVQVTSGGTISAITPAHAAGAVDVVVTNPNLQSSTLAGGFTYADPPPSGGPGGGGGKGCGAAGAPIGVLLGLASFVRRFFRERRRR